MRFFRRKAKPHGYTLRHPKSRNQCRIVPILSKPIITPPGQAIKICNVCQVHHPCKTLHLWCGPNGEVMVSKGVLDQLKEAGMGGFTLESETKTPPALVVGRNGDRTAVDNHNRKQTIYGSELKRRLP